MSSPINLDLPDDKVDSAGGSGPVADQVHRWVPNDANRVFAGLDTLAAYLNAGLLNASDTVVVNDLNVTNNQSPSVGPETDYVGYRASFYEGFDVANVPTSRDFVERGVRGSYSISDGATTSGSPTLGSASDGNFVSALVGATLTGSGIPNGTTVQSVGGLTTLTMSANATATATGVRVTITRATSQDLAYWKHRGALSPTFGVGVTPPDGQARLQVSPQDDEPAMGTVRLRKGPSQTGNVLTIHDSTPTDRLWVDSTFWVSGLHASGGALLVQADATNHRALVMSDNKTTLFGWEFLSATLIAFKCTSSGSESFNVQTDGSLQHTGVKLAFYSATPVTRQTIVALTDNTGGAANDTLQAIPDPADTPASADALRDDIVANVLPAIRNDLADLATKVNEIRTKLVTLGLIQ